MAPMTFVFIGRSGCGKGTQSKLLMDGLKAEAPEHPIFYLQSGEAFRELVKTESQTARLAKTIYDAGGLQPEFLAVWVWADLFMKNITGNEHIIMDGQARKLREAEILESALKFYGRTEPQVIYLKVSREWATARLLERKRPDDTVEDIKKRMDWFEADVLPAIDFFKNHPYYKVHEINSEQEIGKVHEDIMQALWPR